MAKTAIIIGAGPAGLTAAYELLKRTGIRPVILEASDVIGGISRTAEYKGNRMDMGGHRFFSKSERVMDWWTKIMPLQGAPSKDDILLGRAVPLSDKSRAPDPEKTDKVMLVRNRLSRIFYLRKFFDYPVTLNMTTIGNLGLIRMMKIGFSYIKARLFPIRREKNLEDFMVNRFGRELFNTFFNDYTTKVWGVPPSRQQPDWGAQRIKGLSITKVLLHALKSLFKFRKKGDLSQKGTETSLIEQFIYPKFGPGQLWEEVAAQVVKKGGRIRFNSRVVGVTAKSSQRAKSSQGKRKGLVTEVVFEDAKTKKRAMIKGDYFFSTMPVKDLVRAMGKGVPKDVSDTAEGLVYRDYITVGLLMSKLRIKNKSRYKSVNGIIPDLWIYIQERDVKLGRLQIYNNWSPYMVKDSNTVWIGLEYFCDEGDGLWSMSEKDFAAFAVDELVKIDIIDRKDVLDYKVIKIQKTYPAYFGTYNDFGKISGFTDGFENLFLVGRNGMHKYNNMDHSMLTSMTAVDNIIAGVKTKDNIWAVNTEEEYHEEK